jgi:hypothetical protein
VVNILQGVYAAPMREPLLMPMMGLLLGCRSPSTTGSAAVDSRGGDDGIAGEDGGDDGGGAPDSGGTTGDSGDLPCDREGALVYGPTEMAGASLLADLGMEVTVWTAEEWSAAATADFQRFDLIVVGEQSCAGPDVNGELGALVESQDAWGPAIDGRVMASGLDLQCHSSQWEDTATGDSAVPLLLHENSVRWLTAACGTAAMFATDWGRREADHLETLGAFAEVPERGDFVTIEEPEHDLFAGVAEDGLNNWASTFHTMFMAWPDDFHTVATGNDQNGVILLRESPLL